MRKRSAVSCALAFALLAAANAFAGDAWLGTWKLNLAKSKYASENMPRAQTLKFDAAAGGGVTLTADGTDAQGKAMRTGWTSKLDGADVPWTGNPLAETAAPKRVDDHTYTNAWKKGGKVVVNAKVEVSKDGKTLTVTQTPADGTAASTAVYDRQ